MGLKAVGAVVRRHATDTSMHCLLVADAADVPVFEQSHALLLCTRKKGRPLRSDPLGLGFADTKRPPRSRAVARVYTYYSTFTCRFRDTHITVSNAHQEDCCVALPDVILY